MLTFFFFFNDTATTEIYTLSLHDALPILNANGGTLAAADANQSDAGKLGDFLREGGVRQVFHLGKRKAVRDRKSTRLNSSHSQISDAVFCLKKKKNTMRPTYTHITQMQ